MMTPTERVEELALRIIDNPWFENWRQDARDKLISEILKALSLTRREALLEAANVCKRYINPCDSIGDDKNSCVAQFLMNEIYKLTALADKEVGR